MIFRPSALALVNAGSKIETSPTAGSPQRSTPTTPLERYARARSTTCIAVSGSSRRSIERMRLVFMVEVELKVEMQPRIVRTYSSFEMSAEGMARGVVRSSRYTTPSASKSLRTELVV